jgi:uncharacterized phage-associated protein
MNPRTIDIQDLAEFTIRYCYAVPTHISNLKLQKLLYYIQAWHLVYFNKHPLFEVQPEAWVNGPVYRDVYNKFKENYGEHIILETPNSKEESYKAVIDRLNLSDHQSKYLQSVLANYASRSAEHLVFRTHREKPWNEARKGLGPLDYSDSPITFDMMYNYYSSLIKK